MIFNKIFLVLFSSLLLVSCSDDFFNKVIEDDIAEDDKYLALGAFFVDGQDQARCLLTESTGILEGTQSQTDFSDGSVILIYPDGSERPFSYYAPMGRHNFQSDQQISWEENKEYTIKASYKDLPSIEATATLNPLVKIDSIKYEKEARQQVDQDPESAVTIYFKDPEGVSNYYMATLVYVPNGIQSESRYYAESLEPESYSVYNGNVLINANTIDGDQYSIKLYFNDHARGQEKEIFLKWSSISEDHYLFAKSLDAIHEGDDNPFASPIPLYTNVKNGQGLFSIYHEEKYKVDQQ